VEEAINTLNRNGANVAYDPDFLGSADADRYLGQLSRLPEWRRGEACRIRKPFSNEWVPIPRQQTAYGDPGTCYAFSGITVPARPWTPVLLELRERLAPVATCRPNFVLVNRYRNGADSMGWHADDERDLGDAPEILSLTLGAERDFQFRHKASFPKPGESPRRPDPGTLTLRLAHGSLLSMRHPTNRDWKHQLPRRGGRNPEAVGERLNLTWRRVRT
jgi:alpha-ketoglutarate-dependent dioxygenase alkB family protein 2